jgi:hypothetical protein
VTAKRLEDELAPDDLRLLAEVEDVDYHRNAHRTEESVMFLVACLNWAADRIDRLEGREPEPLRAAGNKLETLKPS